MKGWKTPAFVTLENGIKRFTKQDPEERFWSWVEKNGPTPKHRPELGPCWVWTGSGLTKKGYGRFWLGYINRVQKYVLCHRWVMRPVPDGMCVLHKCDNPICVNPTHLFFGTTKDNNRDCREKGRHTGFGETMYSSKLRDADIRFILSYPKTIGSGVQLAKIFSVGVTCISKIRLRKAWKHIKL